MASDLEEAIVETATLHVRNKFVFGGLVVSVEDCDVGQRMSILKRRQIADRRSRGWEGLR